MNLLTPRVCPALLLLAGLIWLPLGVSRLDAAERGLLRTLLTPEEFHRAGLDRLTPEQLEFLDSRLRQAGLTSPAAAPAAPSAPPAPAAASTADAEKVSVPHGEAAFGREQQTQAKVEKEQQIPTAIESQLTGTFRGWRGGTVFHLTNGQVWQQVDSSHFAVNLDSPVVVIEKGLFGAFYLHVKGYGSRVKVRRIQ